VAKFTYVVDRAFKLVEPITFSPTPELKGDAVSLAAGDEVVYRGPIDLGGTRRYAFVKDGAKLFCGDRALLDRALEENYDEMVKP
jgi:hypothetical protein